MNNYDLIPKTSVGKRKVIWRDVSLGDIIFSIIGVILSLSLSFPMPSISLLFKLIICMSILVLMFLLLIKNKTNGLRYYQYFFVMSKFIITKKAYNTKIKNNQLYKGIVDDYVQQSDGKRTALVGAIKVNGINLGNQDVEVQMVQIQNFNRILNQIEHPFTIMKIEEVHDWTNNIKNIEEKIKSLFQDKSLNEHMKNARFNQLASSLEWYEEQLEKKTYLTKGWYIFYYGKNKSQMLNIENEIYSNFNFMFTCEKLNYPEVANKLKDIWLPLSDDYTKEEIKKEKYCQIPKGDLLFKNDGFKINKNYYSIGTLSLDKMPLKVTPYWLHELAMSDSTMIINIHRLSRDKAVKLIQKTINNTAYLGSQYNEYKHAVNKQEFVQQNEIINDVKDAVANNNEVLNNVNIYFLNYGGTASSLKGAIGNLKQIIKSLNMTYNGLNFRQKEYFGAIVPNGLDKHILFDSFTIPNSTLAASFPIQTNETIDDKGVMLGINNINLPVVIDVNVRSKTRINSNALVLGNTGSGKTTTVKKILANHIANDGIAYILDPEQDYVHMTKYFDGKIIDAANGNKSKINPLQIFLNEVDNENDINETLNLISSHVSLLITWFKLLGLPLGSIQLNRLKDLLIEFYKFIGIAKRSLFNMKPNEFPIFDDFVRFLNFKIDELKSKRIVNNVNVYDSSINNYEINYGEDILTIKEVIQNNFCNGGLYANLYNGHSTLKITDNNLVDFDVKNLLAINNGSRKAAQMLLIIAFINNAININGYKAKNPKPALLVVDEAHLFIDKDNPDVLIFLSQMSKRIRKRNGGVWITTQNPSDFIAGEDILRYTRALIENVQYTFIHSLKPNDANAVVAMYQNSPNPITNVEKNFIQQDAKGQCLLIISNKERQCLEIEVSPEEFKCIGNGPTDHFNTSKLSPSESMLNNIASRFIDQVK